MNKEFSIALKYSAQNSLKMSKLFLCAIILLAALCLISLPQAASALKDIREGMEGEEESSSSSTASAQFQPYDGNDPTILGKQNAGNIAFLNDRVSVLDKLNGTTQEQQEQIDSLQQQLDAIAQQQAEFGSSLAGDDPIDVTGVDDEEIEHGDDDLLVEEGFWVPPPAVLGRRLGMRMRRPMLWWP